MDFERLFSIWEKSRSFMFKGCFSLILELFYDIILGVYYILGNIDRRVKRVLWVIIEFMRTTLID